jgi:hypothetical protein
VRLDIYRRAEQVDARALGCIQRAPLRTLAVGSGADMRIHMPDILAVRMLAVRLQCN